VEYFLSSYDDELIKSLKLNKLDMCVNIIDSDKYLDFIEQKFVFIGSKIDWSKTNNHCSKKSNNDFLLTDTRLFITELKNVFFNNNVQVIYIGDNLTEFNYQFQMNNIEDLLIYLLEIPQHHYFVSLEGAWCICISSENYIDFGFSIVSK
jgi:hypothetical protein